MHFRQKLRNIQNQRINKYLAVYKIKQKLAQHDTLKKEEY